MDKELIKRGYKRFNPSDFDDWATDLFQKRIDDENGKKYFINIYKSKPIQSINYPIKYSGRMQFNKSPFTFDVNIFHVEKDNIDIFEQQVEDIWFRMGMQYYERDR